MSGYSTGMRQRLGIAASLLRTPRLLLLDEPSSGLDPAGVRDVWELVGELAADGTAVVLSSHQILEVQGVCDSFTVLRKGRAVWDGTAAQLREHAPAVEYRLTTSDDVSALEIASEHDGVKATPGPEGGLRVQAHPEQLDPYVVALGVCGVAIRGLEVAVGPLEAMFFALTGESPDGALTGRRGAGVTDRRSDPRWPLAPTPRRARICRRRPRRASAARSWSSGAS